MERIDGDEPLTQHALQSDPDSNESGGDPDFNETAVNESAEDENESGGLRDAVGSLLKSDFIKLTPGEWGTALIEYVVELALDNIEDSIDKVNESFVGLPAPGDVSSPETWHNPTNGWWPGIYFAMRVAQTIGILWLSFQTAVSFSYNSAKKRRAAWKRLGIAWMMVLGVTLFAPLGLHLFGELALSIVPDGAEFTQSFGDFAKFGVGLIVGSIIVLFATTVVAMGIVAVVGIYVLAHIAVLFWPLMWPAWASHGQARSYGSTGIYIYGTVCAISVLQAFFLLALFNIDWMEGPGGPLGGLVGLVAGLLFTLVYFPIMLLKQAHIAGAVGLGVAAANSAGGAFDGPRSAAVQKVEQRFEQKWQSFKNRGGQGRPQIGQVSSGYDGPGSPSRSEESGSDPGNGLDAKQSGPVIGRVGNSERDRVNYTHKKK